MEEHTLSTAYAAQDTDFRPFVNGSRRNFMHEALEVPLLTRLLRLPSGGRILEVGCGRGITLPALAAALKPARLVGLDLNFARLLDAADRLADRHVQADLWQADVRALPFPDGSFDMVIDFGTCYHIGNAQRALREIVRVLSPGGLFVYQTPSYQALSHPTRPHAGRLPWSAAPELRVLRARVLWKARVRH